MAAKKDRESQAKTQSRAAVRATISFPRELYDTLGEIAKRNKVSLAWVVREAAEHYLGEKWPLFKGQG
jgi:metal-responsive CopG/Arc/MetJ family transcriptional regulator